MSDVSDMELLRDYARQNSEAAFAELVRRHLNLVYSAALRHARIADWIQMHIIAFPLQAAVAAAFHYQ
ncbi:MAG: hypothetical protein ACREE6_07740 [Limisphaerales bacterium]